MLDLLINIWLILGIIVGGSLLIVAIMIVVAVLFSIIEKLFKSFSSHG